MLPVKKIGNDRYGINFQKNFGFVSDSLINLLQPSFQKTGVAKHYIVNLKNCQKHETVFAFGINNYLGGLTPCRGRDLEVGCYTIQIDLLKKNEFNFYWMLWMLTWGLFGIYLYHQFRKKEAPTSIIESNDHIPLGSCKCYTVHDVLSIQHRNIMLSDKETRALAIFAENINLVVSREQLMKAIREDNGVVVIRRNVDVLVSTLRKKLSEDRSLKFINVHGRGINL